MTRKWILTRLHALWPFLLVGLLLAMRNPIALFRPEFWAEDGSDFFATAFRQGAHSVLLPLGGYQNLIPRLIAAITDCVTVAYAPHVYSWFSWATSTVVLGYLSRSGFSWLIPSRAMRISICCLFVIVPGATEVTQAICNLHTVFTLWFALRLLEEKTWRWSDALIDTLVALSTPELPVLVPLALYLGWRRRSARFAFAFGIIVVVSICNLIGISRLSGDYALASGGIFKVPQVVAERFILYTFLIPPLGPRLATDVFRTVTALFWSLGLFSVVGMTIITKRIKSNQHFQICCLLWLAGASTFGLVFLSRPYLLTMLTRQTGDAFWGSRYGFVAVTFSLIAWAILQQRLASQQSARTRRFALAFLALFFIHVISRPSQSSPRPDLSWPASARELQEIRAANLRGETTDKVVGIRIQPNGYAKFFLP